ncbi:hypothetical protein GobsT_47440 [Gemmata obscuriglobus]|nr:hypothetical protein GobsT_47440 [Gemmata obscuriglobus]VTS09264.1 unnamed protein product [Gemmata obscuriglobus UQM 2246]
MRKGLLVVGAVLPVVTACGIWWTWTRKTATPVE